MLNSTNLNDLLIDTVNNAKKLRQLAILLGLGVGGVAAGAVLLVNSGMVGALIGALVIATTLGLGVGIAAHRLGSEMQDIRLSARAKALTAEVTKSMISSAMEDRRKALAAVENAHAQLARAHREWVDAFDAVHLLVFLHDSEYRIMRANRAYLSMAGMSLECALGKPYWEVFPLGEGPLQGCCADSEGDDVGAKEEITLDDGRIYVSHAFRVDEGDSPYAIHVLEDVTEHRTMVERISHLAHHDVLTGVPNRALFEDRCEQALHLTRRSQRKLALLLLDLDRFKPINDTYGHEVGDEVLKTVARRLQDCVRRRSDTVARLGGDEFVALLPDMESISDAEVVARNMIAAVSAPILTSRGPLDLGVSIGISFFPGNGENSRDLLRNADAAMYQVKKQGRNNYAAAPQA